MSQIVHQQMKHDVCCAFMIRRRLNESVDEMGLVGVYIRMKRQQIWCNIVYIDIGIAVFDIG